MNFRLNLDRIVKIKLCFKPKMSPEQKEWFREALPATSALCRRNLASLRKEVDAAYVRQHTYIKQTGTWFTGLAPLFWEASRAYYSLWRLRSLFAKEDCEQERQRHLERVLAFIEASI